jgi:DNA invertase Pin-like site-specific DNA recombinase
MVSDIRARSESLSSDYTSSTGKLTPGVTGSVAEWYSIYLSEETKKGKTERKPKGTTKP